MSRKKRKPRAKARARRTPCERTLKWTLRACSRGPVASILAALLVLSLSLAILLAFGEPFWSLIGLVALTAAVAPYYARTEYELGPESASIRTLYGTFERPWAAFRAWFADKDGVLLSPLPKPNVLAFRRGLYLRFVENRDEVLEVVEGYLGPQGPDRPDPDRGTQPSKTGRTDREGRD